MKTTQRTLFFTGGTSGLGKVAAFRLAESGDHVILSARKVQKTENILEEFQSKHPEAKGSLTYLKCDLSDLSSVRDAVEQFKKEHNHLDVLVNNAGLWNDAFNETKDGFEETLQVNLMAPVLLIQAFLPLLESSEDARIINTASGLHQGSINFDDLEFRNNFSGLKSYRQSKLGVIQITRLLSKRLEDKNIGIYAQHPGLVSTRLGRNLGWFANIFFMVFGISPEKGAETLLFLAATPKTDLETGEYYTRKKVKQITKESYNMESADQLLRWIDERVKAKGTIA